MGREQKILNLRQGVYIYILHTYVIYIYHIQIYLYINMYVYMSTQTYMYICNIQTCKDRIQRDQLQIVTVIDSLYRYLQLQVKLQIQPQILPIHSICTHIYTTCMYIYILCNIHRQNIQVYSQNICIYGILHLLMQVSTPVLEFIDTETQNLHFCSHR